MVPPRTRHQTLQSSATGSASSSRSRQTRWLFAQEISRSPITPVIWLFIAFTLRISIVTRESLWRDEVDSIRFAFVPLSELFSRFNLAGFNGPLYELLLRVWLNAGGIFDFTARYFSLYFSVLLVPLVYIFTRRVLGKRPALIASWLATTAPLLIWYSSETKMYSLQPALLLLALYALRRAIDRRSVVKNNPSDRLLQVRGSALSRTLSLLRSANGWWAVFVVAVSLGYYVHLLTPLFLPVAITFFLLWWPKAKAHWVGGAIALALCTLPYVPMAIWQVPTLIAGSNTGHLFYTLDTIVYSLLYNWSAGLSEAWIPGLPESTVWLPILIFGIAISIALVQVTDDRAVPVHGMSTGRTVLGLAAWLTIPVLLIYVISTRAPVFEPRYLLWVAPSFYILAATGASRLIEHHRTGGSFVILALSLVSVVGFYAQIVIPIRPDIRGAVQFVARHMQRDDTFVFQIPYTRYAFEYYLPRFAPQWPAEAAPNPTDGLRTLQGIRQHFVDGTYTNAGAMPDDVSADLLPLLSNPHPIWYVESEAAMWDQRGMVRAWLDQHMKLILRDDLRGVTVSLYQKP